MKLVEIMEWLFGCSWDEQAEKSIRDRKISAENAKYGELTSLAYEETLKGIASASIDGTYGGTTVELADSLLIKLAAIGMDRSREIRKINEEYEIRRKEMLIKSKWFLPRMWHEWRKKWD